MTVRSPKRGSWIDEFFRGVDMSQISNVVAAVAGLLRGEGGLQANIDALVATEALPGISLTDNQVIAQHLPADISERSAAGTYPFVYVYCEKASNRLREKSRTFSGEVQMTIEIRVSADRVEDVDGQMNLLVDAVTTTLEQNRGDWGAGVFYGGGYDITFAGLKHGGRNFTQAAKVIFGLEVSRS